MSSLQREEDRQESTPLATVQTYRSSCPLPQGFGGGGPQRGGIEVKGPFPKIENVLTTSGKMGVQVGHVAKLKSPKKGNCYFNVKSLSKKARVFKIFQLSFISFKYNK